MNIWKQFDNLIDKPVRLIGIIQGVYATGAYQVSLIGGGVVQVAGNASYAVGNRVYILAGVIESLAPNLPVFNSVI